MSDIAQASPDPVHVERVSRRYGERLALAQVDLRIGAGEIVALVGANGSGKTTLLKLVGGFLRPTSGRVRVFGTDPVRDPERVMARARFAFAPPALYDSLTASEHLFHLSALHTTDDHESVAAATIDATLELVGLRRRAHDRVRTFSFGMRQRLILAQALVPRPQLLVLDEPTDGLDPLAIQELRHVLARLRREHGMTILLSSHLLVELEHLADRILVLDEGRTVYEGAPAGLIEDVQSLHIEVDAPDRAAACLRAAGYDSQPAGAQQLELTNGHPTLADAVRLLRAGGVELRAYHTHRPTLQEAFLRRMGRTLGQVSR